MVGYQPSARLTVPGGPSVACSTAKAVEWDEAWSKNPDPSGRAAIGVHEASYENKSLAPPEDNNGELPDGLSSTQPRLQENVALVEVQ